MIKNHGSWESSHDTKNNLKEVMVKNHGKAVMIKKPSERSHDQKSSERSNNSKVYQGNHQLVNVLVLSRKNSYHQYVYEFHAG